MFFFFLLLNAKDTIFRRANSGPKCRVSKLNRFHIHIISTYIILTIPITRFQSEFSFFQKLFSTRIHIRISIICNLCYDRCRVEVLRTFHVWPCVERIWSYRRNCNRSPAACNGNASGVPCIRNARNGNPRWTCTSLNVYVNTVST